MRYSYYFFFVLIGTFLSGLACEAPPSNEKPQTSNATAILNKSITPLALPMVFRENLIAERGIQSIDQNGLDQLQWLQFGKYTSENGYYLLGRFSSFGNINCLLLLEDGPQLSKAWLMTYHKNGLLIDQKQVYQQANQSKRPILHSYFKQDTLEITQRDHKRYYRLSEGKFVEL